MKTFSANLQTAMEAEVQTLCLCYKATWTNGTVRGFTTHTEALTIDGVTYSAEGGFDPSQVRAMASMGVDGLDFSGAAVSPAINTSELMEAYWDGARLEIFEVDYTNLAAGTNKLRTGWLGSVETRGLVFKAELRGLMHKLQQTVGRVVQEMCDADFADARCGLTAATYTVTGTVDTVTSRRTFTDAARTEADGVYTYGVLTWISGSNNGLSSAVKAYTVGVVELVESMPRAIQVGDGYSLLQGCSKTRAACVAYSNIVNFRGFPEVPTPNSNVKGP